MTSHAQHCAAMSEFPHSEPIITAQKETQNDTTAYAQKDSKPLQAKKSIIGFKAVPDPVEVKVEVVPRTPSPKKGHRHDPYATPIVDNSVADASPWTGYRRTPMVVTVDDPLVRSDLRSADLLIRTDRVLDPTMKACKFDQVRVPVLSGFDPSTHEAIVKSIGLENIRGCCGLLPVNTFRCAENNRQNGSTFANTSGIGIRQGHRMPYYAPGVGDDLLSHLPMLRAGCITQMYDGPTVARFVEALTGMKPMAVIDKPAQRKGNGMWEIYFQYQWEVNHVAAYTGCAMTGDKGVWIFKHGSADSIATWCSHRRTAIIQMRGCTDDGRPAYGNSPVSFEMPHAVTHAMR